MGNTGSKVWSSFGAELLDLDETTRVYKNNPIAAHRFNVVDIFMKEYILRHVTESFKSDEDLKSVWCSVVPCGSWKHETKVREADDFDFCLLMDNVPGVPSPKVANNNQFHLQVMRRRPVEENRDSTGSDRETGENFHHGSVFVSNPSLGSPEHQGINLGPKYVTEYVDFPIERVNRCLYDLAERFTSHDPVESFWLTKLADVVHNSLTVKIKENSGVASTMTLSWIDTLEGSFHRVNVDVVPAYRNMNKKLSDFYTPPSYFNNPDTLFGKLRIPILSTPLLMIYNPKQNGWNFDYFYAETVIFDHLRRWIPNAVAVYRLVKVIRDAKLPWCCQKDSTTKEVTHVKQFISSYILMNMFLHELGQESEPNDWGRDKIFYRLLGIFQKLYGLSNYMIENWDGQSDFFLPNPKPPMEQLHPVGSDIQHLIGVLNLRNQLYHKGSVSREKECPCCCHGVNSRMERKAPHDVHDFAEKCINIWNHTCILQFKRPFPNKNCSSGICRTKKSPGNLLGTEMKPKKKVRLQEHCSMEKMLKHLPGGKVSVLIATWNMMERPGISSSLHPLLIPSHAHDIYVIGTQETSIDRKLFENQIQQVLGEGYEVFFSENHWALSLIVFMKKGLLPFTSDPEDDHVTLKPRLSWFLRTKGAIGVWFKLFGTSMLFVNAHMTPHAHEMKKRVEDFEQISSELSLPKYVTSQDKVDLNARFDNVFWLGDLNFRMKGGKKLWNQPHVNVGEMLAKYDELYTMQKEGTAFQDFKEGMITFPPTYSYEPDTVNIKMKRPTDHPSYTDRILYKCVNPHGVSCAHYDAVLSMMESDHRPVHGVYDIAIKPSPDYTGECSFAPNHSILTAPSGPVAMKSNEIASYPNGILVNRALPTGTPKQLGKDKMEGKKGQAPKKGKGKKHRQDKNHVVYEQRPYMNENVPMYAQNVCPVNGAIAVHSQSVPMLAGDMLFMAPKKPIHVHSAQPPTSAGFQAGPNPKSLAHSQSVPMVNEGVGRPIIIVPAPPVRSKLAQNRVQSSQPSSSALAQGNITGQKNGHMPALAGYSEASMDFNSETGQRSVFFAN